MRLKRFTREFDVDCEIKKVWAFFMNPKHIELVSPENFNEVLIRCSTPQLTLDSELRVSTGLFVKKHWHSKITSFKEFQEFTDEVQHSRLMKWTHRHYFVKKSDAETRLIDELEFQFGYGLIGLIIERLVLPKIERVFAIREKKIKEILEN